MAHTLAANAPSKPDADRVGVRRGWACVIAICLAYFAAEAPTLHRLEFFDGVEHINLATVLELNRQGAARQWLMPELEGEPRLVKPPLTAWVASVGVRRATVAELASRDPAVRAAAFSRFVWECRWPTLVCDCLLLLAVYELGRLSAGANDAGDWRVGVLAAIVCASCLLFLRQGRRATTDLQLALWVTVANAFLARLLLGRGRWGAALGAGSALGLAVMSKGPHIALLQTAFPAALFAIVARRRGPAPSRGLTAPIVVGAVVAACIGLWWYAYVLATTPGVLNIWFHEVTRFHANSLKPDPWTRYPEFLRWMLPWTPWMLLGIGSAIRDAVARRRKLASPDGPGPDPTRASIHPADRPLFALFALLAPLLVMSLSHERQERYLTPFAAPAAVMAAIAMASYYQSTRASGLQRLAAAGAWIAVAWLAVAVPILGATRLHNFTRFDRLTPWFTPSEAAIAACVGAAVILSGFLAARRRPFLGAVAISLAAWLGAEMQFRAYAVSNDDTHPQRLLADELWASEPDAIVYSAEPPTKYGNLSLPAIALSLYFDRIVRTRPPTLPSAPTGRPMVLLTEAPAHRPPPILPGWRRLEVLPMREGQAQYVDLLAP